MDDRDIDAIHMDVAKAMVRRFGTTRDGSDVDLWRDYLERVMNAREVIKATEQSEC